APPPLAHATSCPMPGPSRPGPGPRRTPPPTPAASRAWRHPRPRVPPDPARRRAALTAAPPPTPAARPAAPGGPPPPPRARAAGASGTPPTCVIRRRTPYVVSGCPRGWVSSPGCPPPGVLVWVSLSGVLVFAGTPGAYPRWYGLSWLPHAVSPHGVLTMTVPSSRIGASSVLGHVLVLVAVLVSSLCVAGQSAAATSVRAEPVSATAEPASAIAEPASAIAEPASVTAGVRPAVGPYASPAAAERDSVRS